MVIIFVCFVVYCESTAVTEMCVGLQNSVDGGESIPSVWSEEEDHLAVALPAVKAADTVCYVCNIVVLTVVQAVLWHLHAGSVLCGV